jgi:signal-transduction protein with cAMP-binding, CBS, and nucleotidyltransferase domain
MREAARMMVEKGTGAALVHDDERPVPCIVTERDLLTSIGRGEDPDVELVSEHMSEGVVAASPDWSLEHAASEMSTRGIRHLVVFDAGNLVGILSIRDIVRVWTAEGATSGMSPD